MEERKPVTFELSDEVDDALELDRGERGEQPFIRCLHCQSDNPKRTTSCGTCSKPLDTDEQREFNQRYWVQRLIEREKEMHLEEEREQQRALNSGPTLYQLQRQLGQSLAKEVAQHERSRMTADAIVEASTSEILNQGYVLRHGPTLMVSGRWRVAIPTVLIWILGDAILLSTGHSVTACLLAGACGVVLGSLFPSVVREDRDSK